MGSCLFCYVEGVAVGLRVQPAAAEGLPQDGVIGFLDALWGAQRHAGGTRRRVTSRGLDGVRCRRDSIGVGAPASRRGFDLPLAPCFCFEETTF